MDKKQGYIPQDQRKKILMMCDDIRMFSGVSLMAREIITGTSHQFNWVNIGGAINHPEHGKLLDISLATNKNAGIDDSSVLIYPISGYGTPELLRHVIESQKPDAIMIFTDPRYWIWLFGMEHEIRKNIPLIYLNIWDNEPIPMYNKPYYESCDALFAISKLTEKINKEVLGEELCEEKVIKYIPHGINEDKFYPIIKEDEYFQIFKDELFKGKEYDFKLLYNARNLRRKSVPDLIHAWIQFVDNSTKYNDNKKSAFVLHTQILDENGTDLQAVVDLLTKGDPKYNIIFHEDKLSPEGMNYLYNSCDFTILTSSNEGWGLSLTESMMCGKPIIANATGGMIDQMNLEHSGGGYDTQRYNLSSLHTHTKSGNWALPVFPSNRSIIGSPQTPYIYDDRASSNDIAYRIEHAFNMVNIWPIKYEASCKAAREWVTSKESMMSSKHMCQNIFKGIHETLAKFTPRHDYELIEL